MIGVSRETVTRLLGELRDKRIIQLKGSSLLIKNKAVLEDMVNP
jgi:CRP-like cAMP-binding protein